MKGFIKNRASLAKKQLRKDALDIIEAGLSAVRTSDVIKRSLKRKGDRLTVGGQLFDLKKFRRVFVVGIGKAAFDAAKAIEDVLGSARIAGGVVLDVKSGRLKKLKSVSGSHPFPTIDNMRATGEIMALLKQLDARDLVITIVSGGGSALLCWPYKLKCDQITVITQLLMRRGATIREINTVRKHISEIQGGQFARLAYPATVLGLIFSDIPGADMGLVASGPTVLDPTTVQDAARVLAKYDVVKACSLPDCELIETPKDPSLFEHVHNHVLVSNREATEAMLVAARQRGYHAKLYSNEVQGEARDVGRLLVDLARPGDAIVAAGETTVTVRKPGKGGRNLELSLGALGHLSDDTLVISFATDGIDNTPIAAGIADAITKKRAHKLGLDPEAFLRDNRSYDFFNKTGAAVRTGVTGINVSDVMLVLRERD